MVGAFHPDQWGGQRTQLLIVAREFRVLEQHCDARATGQGMIGPAGINAQFHQQCSRPPAGMCLAHLHDGIAHARWKRAERPSDRAAHLETEAGALPVLTEASPFAHRPD